MNILHIFGKRLSNGAKINRMNHLELQAHGLATKKDDKLLEKTLRSNLQKTLKRRSKRRDKGT